MRLSQDDRPGHLRDSMTLGPQSMTLLVSFATFLVAWSAYWILRRRRHLSVTVLALFLPILLCTGWKLARDGSRRLRPSTIYADALILPIADLSQQIKIALGTGVSIEAVGLLEGPSQKKITCTDEAPQRMVLGSDSAAFIVIPPHGCELLHLVLDGGLALKLKGDDPRCVAHLIVDRSQEIRHCDGSRENHQGEIAILPESTWKFAVRPGEAQTLSNVIAGLPYVRLSPAKLTTLYGDDGERKLPTGLLQYVAGSLNLHGLRIEPPARTGTLPSIVASLEGDLTHSGVESQRSLSERLTEAFKQVQGSIMALLTGLILILDFRKKLKEEIEAARSKLLATTSTTPPIAQPTSSAGQAANPTP